LEAANLKFMERVRELEETAKERDSVIKSLREDNVYINREKNLFKVRLDELPLGRVREPCVDA